MESVIQNGKMMDSMLNTHTGSYYLFQLPFHLFRLDTVEPFNISLFSVPDLQIGNANANKKHVKVIENWQIVFTPLIAFHISFHSIQAFCFLLISSIRHKYLKGKKRNYPLTPFCFLMCSIYSDLICQFIQIWASTIKW